MSNRIAPIERFWAKVEKRADGCWVWLGAKNPDGYGNMRCGPANKPKGVHRFAYEELVGPIPEGHQIDHLCENPSCVNPEHLEPVIGYVNNERGKRARQTHCKRGHPLSGDNLYIGAGKRRVCRECQRLAQEQWRLENPDRAREISRKHYATHREEQIAKTMSWREANREHFLAYQREWNRKQTEKKRAEPSP